MKLETFLDYKEDVEKFEKYLQENYEGVFPENINQVILSRFLKTCNRDFETSSQLLKRSLDIRSKHKDLFVDRDFFDKKTFTSGKIL
jgi:hypothetical protein